MVKSEAFKDRPFTPDWRDRALFWWCIANVVAGVCDAGYWIVR
jgi:hypothetical protein